MNQFLDSINVDRIKRTAKALEKHNMEVHCVPDRTVAVEMIRTLMKKGDTCAVGGSVTLDEIGALDLLRNGDYVFFDRYAPGLTAEEITDIHRKAFSCDTYLSSSNAVTEDGYLFNVDGGSNRVAAILFGPKQVILVIGRNKIVRDLDAASERVRRIAAPANARRLHCDTYCAQTGECMAVGSDCFGAGCTSPGRICANFVVSGPQRTKNRIKIILVDEELGY